MTTAPAEIRRPAELILTTAIYDVLRLSRPPTTSAERATLSETILRHQLCKIAHDADLAVVLKALAAIGGPADLHAITEQVGAIRERAAGSASP